jgi:hypothetical protein
MTPAEILTNQPKTQQSCSNFNVPTKKTNWTDLKPTESFEIRTKPDESISEPTEVSPNQYKTQQNWQKNCMNQLKLVKTYC